MKRAAARSSSSTGRLPARRIDNLCQKLKHHSSTTTTTMLLASLVRSEFQRCHHQQRRAIHSTTELRGPSDSTATSSLLDDDDTPTELLIDGELLGDDELLSTSGIEVTGDADSEGLIGCMDDYESLLEDSILSGGNTASTTNATNIVEEEEVAITYTFSQLTEMVLGLLPADASSVPLTAITPGLDDAMEYICDKYGSLLSFLKLNNSKVVIESKAGGKFFVRRVLSVHRQSELASEAERGQALRRASQRAEAEAETVRQNAPPPKRTAGRRVKLQRIDSSNSSVLEEATATAGPLLALFLKDVFSGIDADSADGKVVPVFLASQMLDPATKSAIREKYTTVTKFLRSQGHMLDVSWDCSKVGYPKGASMSASDLVPPPSIQAKYPTSSTQTANADEEFAGDEWAVDLGVGEDGDVAAVVSSTTTSLEEEEAGDLPVDEDARQFTSAETADRESFYSGVAGGGDGGGAAPKKLSTAEIRAIPAAPAAPVDAMSASTLVNIGSDTVGGKVPPLLPGQSPPLSKEMATKMEEAHTQLAESKGWKTPRAMLDLFVECVPTFYVAISHLTVPQALQEAVGKNTLFKVFKAYVYFFEMKVEDGTHFVKLRDIVDHDKKGGVTDELYAHVKGKKTRTIGHGAFPVLDRFMGRTGSLSDYIKKKKKEWEQKPARLRIPEPPVRRALRRAVDYDSLSSIDEALVARVKQEAYTIKSEERARKMKLAIAITTTASPADAHDTTPPSPTATPIPQQDDPAIEAITLAVVVEELMVTRCNDYLFYPPLEVGGGPVIQAATNTTPTTTTTTTNTPSPLQSSWPPRSTAGNSSLDAAAADRGEWVENTGFKSGSSSFTAGFGGAISMSEPSPPDANQSTPTPNPTASSSVLSSAVDGRLVRLRPFWTAPHSTAEYTLATSPYGRDTVHPIASHIRSAGLWTPLSKALERVSLSAARKVQDSVLYMNADRFNRPSSTTNQDTTTTSFADSLPTRFGATDQYEDVPVTMMSWSAPGESQGGYAKTPQRADRLPYIKAGSIGEESTTYPDVVGGDDGDGRLLALLRPYFPTRLVDLLRLHGGVTWVDCAPNSNTTTPSSSDESSSSSVRLRKFTGFVDLDDVEHTLVDELRYALVCLQTEYKDKGNITEFTVDEVCGAVAPTYRGMLTYTEDATTTDNITPSSSSSPSSEFLSVPLEGYGAPVGCTLEVPFQRHPPYHRLLRFLTDHKKFFDVRVEEKKIVPTSTDEGSLEGAVRHARQEHMRAKERARRKEARAAAGHAPEGASTSTTNDTSHQQLKLPVNEGDVGEEDDQVPRRVLYISAANIFGRQQHQNLRSHPATSSTSSTSSSQPTSQSEAKLAVSKAVKAHEDEPDCSPSAAQFAASATHYMQDLATAAAIVSPAKYKRAGMQPEPKASTPQQQQQPNTTSNTTKWDPRSAASSSWGGVVGKRR